MCCVFFVSLNLSGGFCSFYWLFNPSFLSWKPKNGVLQQKSLGFRTVVWVMPRIQQTGLNLIPSPFIPPNKPKVKLRISQLSIMLETKAARKCDSLPFLLPVPFFRSRQLPWTKPDATSLRSRVKRRMVWISGSSLPRWRRREVGAPFGENALGRFHPHFSTPFMHMFGSWMDISRGIMGEGLLEISPEQYQRCTLSSL